MASHPRSAGFRRYHQGCHPRHKPPHKKEKKKSLEERVVEAMARTGPLPSPIKLSKILEIVHHCYPDGVTKSYTKRGRFHSKPEGDLLAMFIVQQIIEGYREGEDSADQLLAVTDLLDSASRILEKLSRVLSVKREQLAGRKYGTDVWGRPLWPRDLV